MAEGFAMTMIHMEPLDSGDVVRRWDDPATRYEVMAVDADKAWVRDLASGADQISSRTLFARIRAVN
jgi:hypothetical protein